MKNKTRAVFLDRDGVICREKSYITAADQMEIYPFAVEAIKMLREAGWKCILVTNQSAVARGMLSEGELKQIHDKLLSKVPLDAIYYCPHLPPEKNEVYPYLIKCACRKPEAGMILSAAKEYEINLEASFLVGDRQTDVLAGKKAGVKTVLVKTGYGSKEDVGDIQPDYVFYNLFEFAEFLLRTNL